MSRLFLWTMRPASAMVLLNLVLGVLLSCSRREMKGDYLVSPLLNSSVFICDVLALVPIPALLMIARTQPNSCLISLLRVSSARAAMSLGIDILCLGPFVTTVGATTQIDPEVAIGFSGGGFSNYFGTPSYQAADTGAFLENLGTTYSGLYK